MCVTLRLPSLNFTFTSLLWGGPSATPPISAVFTTLGQVSIANKLVKAPLEYSYACKRDSIPWKHPSVFYIHALQCLHLLPALNGFGEKLRKKEAWTAPLPPEQCACNRIAFILPRTSWISTGDRPGGLPWVRVPGTPAAKHWLPAQPAVRAVVNLLAQTQCTQTVVDSFLNCTGTG